MTEREADIEVLRAFYTLVGATTLAVLIIVGLVF